ncbi:MAG TPA: acetoacetate decarboxylase [Opitutaceae bacterium]|nr:acetoacetate decarboxylase [Opitutaceae bacterium]
MTSDPSPRPLGAHAPDPLHAWSTPLAAPLAPAFPFTFRNIDVLTLTYRTSREAAARLLPPPLELTSDWVLVHIYNMNDVDWLGRYGECNVMLGAGLPGRLQGGFSPFLFLNSDGGLAQGREVHGQPKKWANPRVEFRSDLIVGVVERNGIDVVTGTMVHKHTRGDLENLKRATFDFGLNLNYKVVQHIDGRPAIRQLTARRLEDVQVHECWADPCSVELRPNMQAPLHLLPVLETGLGYYWRATFTLVPGKIVHDYLA